MLAANPQFDPVRPVMFATVRRCEHDETVPQIGERVTSRCGDLFNVSYEILLQMMERYFAHTEETDAQLATLADATISLMVGVVKPLGNLITTQPVGADYPGKTAGPSFELFYENDYLMPHRDAAWALLEERVREAANFCGLVQEIASEHVADELAPVQDALTDVADSLASHFGGWGGASRFRTPVNMSADVDDQAMAALSKRVSSLARAVSASTASPDGAGQLASLFTSASAAIEKAGDRETVRRLVESVLRPLAEAVSGKRLRGSAKAERPDKTQDSVPPQPNPQALDECVQTGLSPIRDGVSATRGKRDRASPRSGPGATHQALAARADFASTRAAVVASPVALLQPDTCSRPGAPPRTTALLVPASLS